MSNLDHQFNSWLHPDKHYRINDAIMLEAREGLRNGRTRRLLGCIIGVAALSGAAVATQNPLFAAAAAATFVTAAGTVWQMLNDMNPELGTPNHALKRAAIRLAQKRMHKLEAARLAAATPGWAMPAHLAIA